MKGMILAAGFGTRLRPLTDSMAKPSLPVVNIPLILYSLNLLKNAGIRDVVINLHYHPESIKKILGHGRKMKIKIHYSIENQILGTGGGIKKAEKYLQDDSFIVFNGDIICDVDLQKVIAFHKERDALATMVLRENNPNEKFGIIGIDIENRIRRFTNLIRPEKGERNLKRCMFTGIHVFRPDIFEYIPPAIESCINQYTYPRLIKNYEGVFGFVTDGFWSDLGTLRSYWETNMALIENPTQLTQFDPLADYQFAPKREVDRVIRMGKGVDLKEGVTLIDPVVIGDHCTIGKDTILGPHAILGKGCEIEKNNHIKESILWSGTKTPENLILQQEIWTGKIKVPMTSNGKVPKSVSSVSG